MEREWTNETRDAWIARRTARRKQRGKPEFLRDVGLEAERESVKESMNDIVKRTISWELPGYPPRSYPAPFSGKILFPLGYLQNDSVQSVKFKEGEDLNYLVYAFYMAPPDPSSTTAPNYVSTQSIAPKRHEYLGPAPSVAGFRFDLAIRTARIEWWDRYTGARWIGTDTWSIAVYFDTTVRGWVSRPRGDCDEREALDLKSYLGAP